jgi:hypothetical protein
MDVSRCLCGTRNCGGSVDGCCLLEGLAPGILTVVLVLYLDILNGQTGLVPTTVRVTNSSDFSMIGS